MTHLYIVLSKTYLIRDKERVTITVRLVTVETPLER